MTGVPDDHQFRWSNKFSHEFMEFRLGNLILRPTENQSWALDIAQHGLLITAFLQSARLAHKHLRPQRESHIHHQL